jgi:hypothetical protein
MQLVASRAHGTEHEHHTVVYPVNRGMHERSGV